MVNILEEIRKTLTASPLFEGDRINVNYIGTNMAYSLDPLPCDPIIQRYVDGGARKQYQFAFMSKDEYDEDVRINIENSGFYEAFEDLLEELNNSGNLPALGLKKSALFFEPLNKGYLYDIAGNKAKYRIECRLVYSQEV